MYSYLRFALASGLLAATALLLHARGGREIIPSHAPLSSFPRQLGTWIGSTVPISQEELDVLGAGDFLHRIYQDRSANDPYVDFFLAYFPTQRSGDTIHSPKNCLPGAGWSPVQSSHITLSLPGQAAFPANRYIIAKGIDQQLVIYWYWAHNRGVANEYWAKFYLVADAMRMNRSDGALVRLITPLRPGESPEQGQQRLLSLASNVTPILNSYVPR